MNSVDVANIDKVRYFFKELKPGMFPLNHHPLENEEEYSKELYITLLCSVAQYDNAISFGENNLIRRIIIGVGLEDDINKYLKRGLEIDSELVSEFVRYFADSNLSYNFILDSLVLSGCDGKIDENVIGFIAELAEILNIDREKIEFISSLALAVLEQNGSKYDELMTIIPHKVSMKNYLYYTKEFANGLIVDEKEYKYFYSKTHLKVDFSNQISFKGCKVIFENIIVDLAEDKGKLNFRGCEDIKFTDCDFRGIHNPIIFNACGDIDISNCKFVDFENHAIEVSNSKSIEIKESKFENCVYYSSNNVDIYGGAIFIKNTENIYIYFTEFNKCNTISWNKYDNYDGMGSGIYIEYGNVKTINISKCKFIDCNHYYNGGRNKSSDRNHGTIWVLASQQHIKDNTFIGCDRKQN